MLTSRERICSERGTGLFFLYRVLTFDREIERERRERERERDKGALFERGVISR